MLSEMVGAVDARHLDEQFGHLSHDERRGVDDGLSLVHDLSEPPAETCSTLSECC